MRKDALLKWVRKAEKEKGRFSSEDKRLTAIKKFLESDPVLMLNKNEEIAFSDYATFLSSQAPSASLLKAIRNPNKQEAIVNKLLIEFQRAEKSLDETSSLHVVPPEIRDRVRDFLDPKSLAQLGSTSATFYAENAQYKKSQHNPVFKKALLAAGCNAELLERVEKLDVIKDYQHLSQVFSYLPQEFKPLITSRWQLLILSGEAAAVQYALTHSLIDAKTRDSEFNTVFSYAALGGNQETLERLIKALDPTFEARNNLFLGKSCSSILHYAALSSNVSLVDELIQKYKMDPGATDRYQQNALHYAARGGHLAMVKFLIQSGCRVDENVIYSAAEGGDPKTLHWLANNANQLFKKAKVSTLFLLAVKSGNIEAIMVLRHLALDVSKEPKPIIDRITAEAETHANSALIKKAVLDPLPAAEATTAPQPR